MGQDFGRRPAAAMYTGYIYYKTEEKEKKGAVKAFLAACRDLRIGTDEEPVYELRPDEGELFAAGNYLALSYAGDGPFREDCWEKGINTDNLHLVSVFTV